MILLAALTGLRVHEVAKMRGEDVDIDGRTLRVTGKGGRSDTIPLHPLLVAVALMMPERGWWFPASNRRPGEHIHGKSVSDIIGNAMRRAGIVGTPHSLRHWYGTNLVAARARICGLRKRCYVTRTCKRRPSTSKSPTRSVSRL